MLEEFKVSCLRNLNFNMYNYSVIEVTTEINNMY